MNQIGFNPQILPSSVEETFDLSLSPSENAEVLAMKKAQEVAAKVGEGIVIGADTIVAIDGQMLGKPADRRDAARMLEMLSGRTHLVYTGVALVDRPSGSSVHVVEATRVTFRRIPREEIEEYVSGGSPLDKAGAYGIQDDYGAVFVTRVEGCFYNVVGFPVSKFYTTLQTFQTQLLG